MTDQVSFDGTLLEVPFGSRAVRSVLTEQYRALISQSDPDDVLVLTGSPTSMGTVRETLTDECPGAAVPRVSSPIVHATGVINRTDDRAILSDAMRRELVHRFLSDWEWESAYLQRAAQQDSFATDIAQILETATWQNFTVESTPGESSPEQEIATVRNEFHDWLKEHDHLERGQMITEATRILSDVDQRETVLDAEALLVVEFEEFVDSDRRYLHSLASDCDLVCIAERDSSVRRTWVETGPVTDYVSFTEQRVVDAVDPKTRPAATSLYFARGESSTDPENGEVYILTAETADDEIKRVANAIEGLCEREAVGYEDIAVAVKHSGQAVVDVLQALEQVGIPTTSATVIGFGDDPAIRELVQVVHELATDGDGHAALSTDTSVLADEMRVQLAAMSHLGNALRTWATDSGLKERIASESPPLDARAQFGDVKRAFAMADFLEDTAFVDATWDSLAAMLERAFEYAPQENQTSAIENDGGVRVDHVKALKNGSFTVVFMLDVIDPTYPGKPNLGRIFPFERATRMQEYPGVTQVDTATVDATFSTDSTTSSRPFRQYNVEHARRQLAIGASVATERVYFCFHTHSGTALEERVQPSRFLTDAYRNLPWMKEVSDEDEITSERAAEAYLLSRVDRALTEVRRANSQDITVSLDAFEADFAEIQALLDESGERGDRLRDAMQARLDFAAGRVRRE